MDKGSRSPYDPLATGLSSLGLWEDLTSPESSLAPGPSSVPSATPACGQCVRHHKLSPLVPMAPSTGGYEARGQALTVLSTATYQHLEWSPVYATNSILICYSCFGLNLNSPE